MLENKSEPDLIQVLFLLTSSKFLVMANFRLGLLLLLLPVSGFAQRLHVGVFGGASAYQGDLTDKIFPKKTTNGAIGLTLNYELTDQVMLRGGLTYTVLSGADRYNKDTALQHRNLNFETSLTEFSLVGEYYIFNLYNIRFSPYVFGGVALYHYNPYTYYGGNKVYLQPLGTEGQGLAGYGIKYSLTQMAIPFGGGVKYAVSDRIRLGAEFGMRKLFTDYLDDVSTNYADATDLLTGNGQMAVNVAYRGDEVAGGSSIYPAKGSQRGGAKFKDWYYMLGLHLTYRLSSDGSNKKSGMGCPKF